MKVKTAFPIQKLSGKAESSSDLVFSTRYGDIHAWRMRPKRTEFDAGQIELMKRFKAATQKACKDMEDPVKKAEWTYKMRNSYGEYKTARGCAFAHYYKTLTPEEIADVVIDIKPRVTDNAAGDK